MLPNSSAMAYPEIPDRDCYLMLLSNTLIKATRQLTLQALGQNAADQCIKSQLEVLGRLLSKDTTSKFDIQVTVR